MAGFPQKLWKTITSDLINSDHDQKNKKKVPDDQNFIVFGLL